MATITGTIYINIIRIYIYDLRAQPQRRHAPAKYLPICAEIVVEKMCERRMIIVRTRASLIPVNMNNK